jgi:hypothetical protein
VKNLSIKQNGVLLRSDFRAFIEGSFHELNHSAGYKHNWHLAVVADRLEQVRRGEIKWLIINMPPRSLKSHCASVTFPAFVLGHDPAAQIICVSYGQDLSDKLSGDCLRSARFTQSG